MSLPYLPLLPLPDSLALLRELDGGNLPAGRIFLAAAVVWLVASLIWWFKP